MALLPISDAAAALGTTPRALRYREHLGLLPAERSAPSAHRRYSPAALHAAAAAMDLEHGYDASPAEVAFALRALAEPRLHAELRRLGELTGRLPRTAVAALDFESQKGRRLLHMTDDAAPSHE